MPLPTGPTQEASGGATGSSSPFTVTFGAAPAAGASVVLIVTDSTTTSPPTGTVSGLGATWTRVYQSTTTNGGNVQVWLGTGCNGSTSVITFTPSFSADWAAMASEWFAITDATANVDDINIAGAGPLPTLSIGATYTYSFLIDALALTSSVTAATGLTAGWAALTAKTQGGTRAQGAYQRLPVPPGPSSPYTVGWTLNAAQSYQHVVILFRGAPLAAVNGTATLAGVGVLRATATGVIPINPLPLEARVYAAANPLGPAIAVWNGQRGLSTHDEHNATGAGRLTLLVSDPKATPTNLAQYNLVRVFLGPFDVFDFWVETPDWTIASPDGGAGESVVVAGRGLEAYLERALVWLSGASFTAQTAGTIMGQLIADAQARGALTLLRTDFTNALDSAGVAWAGDLAAITLSLTEGTDYLSVLGQLRQIGVIARMRADFTLQLFQSFGTNQKAAGVTLRQGRHFPGPVNWTQPQAKAANAMMARGAAGYAVVYLPGAGALPDRFEGYVKAPETTDLGTVGAVAIAEVTRRNLATTAVTLSDIVHGLNAGDVEPYRHFDKGDTIGLDIVGAFDNASVLVAAIDLESRDDARYHASLSLGSVRPEVTVALARQVHDLAQPTG